MLVGATGWASGNQLLTGTSPALTPNPKNESRKIANRSRIGQSRRGGSQRGETKPARGSRDQYERDRRCNGPCLAHRQHDVGGRRAFGAFEFVVDEEIARDRHQFPRDDEGDHVVGDEQQYDRSEQGVVKDAEIAKAIVVEVFLEVGAGVERHRQIDQAGDEEKERGESVGPESERPQREYRP